MIIFSSGSKWAILSPCLNQAVNACSGCCWCGAAGVFWLGLSCHIGVWPPQHQALSLQSLPSSQQIDSRKREVSSALARHRSRHTRAPEPQWSCWSWRGACWQHGRHQVSSSSWPEPGSPRLFQMIVAQMGPYGDGSVTVCWDVLSCLICHV